MGTEQKVAVIDRHRRSHESWRRALVKNKKDFSRRFPNVARALEALSGEIVIDG